MTEHFLQIPQQDLPHPPGCQSPDVIAVMYVIRPKLEKPVITDIKCRQSDQCPVETCQYKNIFPLIPLKKYF